MEKEKFYFEQIAPDYCEIVKKLYEEDIKATLKNYQDHKDEEYLNGIINNEDDILTNRDGFLNCLKMDEKLLSRYLEKYFHVFDEAYNYFEFEYSGFGEDFNYLPMQMYGCLYLCGKYFENKGNQENANKAFFYFLCFLAQGEATCNVLDYIEYKLESMKSFIFADWLAIHPQVTYLIGNYYRNKQEQTKAKEFYELGASLDYEERQSYRPSLEVGKNRYELGMILFNNAKTQDEYYEAFKLFEQVANDIGEPSLPIMGDMYYEGLGVEQDYEEAIQCYKDFELSNLDIKLYFKNLNEIQKDRLKTYLDNIDLDTCSFNELTNMEIICKVRLDDFEKIVEIKNKRMQRIELIPQADRDKFMDRNYAIEKVDELKRTLNKPTENTGSIPKKLKENDVFEFGYFNQEPLKWKVIEVQDDSSALLISDKTIVKMTLGSAEYWVEEFFFEHAFTDDEKEQIIPVSFGRYNIINTYVFLPSVDEARKVANGTIQQTEFAKQMSKVTDIICKNSKVIDLDGNQVSRQSYEVGRVHPVIRVRLKK